MAAINLKEGEQLDDDKVQEIGSLCREKLPGYARPRWVIYMLTSASSLYYNATDFTCSKAFYGKKQ